MVGCNPYTTRDKKIINDITFTEEITTTTTAAAAAATPTTIKY